MDALEPDDLYEERNGVSYARPILQGDVFESIQVPGFGEDPLVVQIITHPCSMRRGNDLNERIQIAPVAPHARVDNWDGFLRVMPLPDLREDGKDHATRFVDTTAVPSAALTPDNRIASLSHRGILVLQQRIVKHSTRLDLTLDLFREQSAPVLAEAELQEIWVEDLLGNDATSLDAVDAANASFQGWLNADDKKRRGELTNEANHARLRRETRHEARSRRSHSAS